MANQIDNLTLNDDTTGFNRAVNVASDDLFLSVDLTLQSGGILTADNVKRGTTEPNVALLAGNEGDVYQRTLAATGELYVNTDGTTTGWSLLLTGAGATPTWAAVLAVGSASGGTDPVLTSGDVFRGESGASLAGTVALEGGSATSGTAVGGDVSLTAGAGFGGASTGGDVDLTAGAGTATGVGGAITITSGGSAGLASGDVTIQTGVGGTVGTLNILGGGVATDTGGGSINIVAGAGEGNVTINSGAGNGLTGASGDITLQPGAVGTGEPGDIQLISSGGQIELRPAAGNTVSISGTASVGSGTLQYEEVPSVSTGISAGEGRTWVRDDTPNVYMFTDDAGTDWVLNGPGSATAWSDVLTVGNTSGGTDAEISSGDAIVGEDNGAGDGGDLPITAGSATAANDNGGDVVINPGSGFGTGVDGIVQVNGPKHYANSTTDPTVPTPAEGDRYYNTTLDMEMRYDSTRSKWLSVESFSFQSSDAGALTNGSYHQNGNVRFTSTRGLTAHFDGTVVSLSYTRSDSDAASVAVTSGGTTVATLASSATSGQSTSLDGDFTQGGVLGTRNDGANSMSNSQVWVRVRWRA